MITTIGLAIFILGTIAASLTSANLSEDCRIERLAFKECAELTPMREKQCEAQKPFYCL